MGTAFFLVVIGIVWFAILLYVLFYAINNMAEKNFLFTHVPSGEIVFVVAGESLVRPIANVKGWRVNRTTGCMKKKSKFAGLLARWLGIYWVGLYPFRQLHWYKFSWTSWEDKKDADGKVITRAMEQRNEPVRSMYFEYTYPIKVTAAELKDGFKIDLYLNVTVQAYNVYTAIFKLKGDWFVPFAKATSGAVADYVRKYTFKEFQTKDKEGPTSELAETIVAINDPKTKGGHGIAESLGVKVVAVHYEKFDITPDEREQELEAATQAVELAKKRGEAAAVEAKLRAEAIKSIGNAEAEVIIAKLAAANGDAAIVIAQANANAQVDVAKNTADGMARFAIGDGKTGGGKTLVLGNAQTGVVVPTI